QAAVRAQRLADGGDVDLQGVLFDDRAGPDAVHQIVLGDELAVGLHQFGNDVEGAATERHRHPARTQFTAREVDLPPIRAIDRSVALFRQHMRPLLRNWLLLLLSDLIQAICLLGKDKFVPTGGNSQSKIWRERRGVTQPKAIGWPRFADFASSNRIWCY